MRRVIWTEPALHDLHGIREYIGQFSPLAAQRMSLKLVAAANSLAEHPERGLVTRRGRELAVIAPYLIRYRVIEAVIYIQRVRHGARRPLK